MTSVFRRAGRALLALAALSAAHTTYANDLPPHARNGRLWAMIQAETQGMFVASSPATELWFTQRVDHFSSEDRDAAPTFQQRFYEVDTYWDGPDGPVILYIGGEATMDKAPTGFVDTLAKHWGAKILALEHRFYGKSIPNKNISSANYKYLTVQQALADLDYFKREYEAKHLPGKHNKWVAVGGSYPGALSAWFRVAYPNTTVAALSSSGVVLPVYKFTGFDEQVAESAGQECADAMRKATAAFEDEIQRGHSAEVKGLLGAEALADGDFFYMLADAAAMAVQYGHKDVVCSALMNAVKKELSMPQEFAKFVIDMYGKEFGSGCFYDTACLAKADLKWVDARSWRWQKCSQLAYFQVAPAEGSLRASIVDLDYHEQQCKAVFGDGLNAQRGTEEVIQLYGGAKPKAHHIFFANGGDDPWQRASVLESLSDDEVAVLAKCDLCGHCGDLHALTPNAPEPLKKQQEAILRYLTKWLHGDDADDTSAATVATQTETKHTQVGYGKEVYRSSPFVLVPIVLAFIVLLAVVHSDALTDAPARRRGGYVRLDAV